LLLHLPLLASVAVPVSWCLHVGWQAAAKKEMETKVMGSTQIDTTITIMSIKTIDGACAQYRYRHSRCVLRYCYRPAVS
jgi:hypothetical protein